ncbi:MAG: DUF937 domain-containing protein [Oscillospiraceae bacterium]|nr:DUF937 domain-containing protein [Oscillospiraceae bacterium]
MSDLNLNSIMSLLSGDGTSAISKRTKVSKSDVANVLSAGVPILLTGMQRNAGTQSGEASLRGALKDHAAADVSDPGAFLKNADLKDGKKILGHVLGSDQKAIVKRVSDASGVTKAKTTSILALIAPLLLSLLGGQQSQQGSGFSLLGMLGGLLGGGQQEQEEQEPEPQTQSGGGLLDSLGGLGGLAGLFGGSQQEEKPQSGGLFSSFLNLFRG